MKTRQVRITEATHQKLKRISAKYDRPISTIASDSLDLFCELLDKVKDEDLSWAGVLQRAGKADEAEEILLDSLDGFVESIRDGVATVRLTGQNGISFYGEYSEKELLEKGIKELRRFKCLVYERGSGIEIDLQPISVVELSDERIREIEDEVENSFKPG